MKGLTHFVAGMAAASFFPQAVQAAAGGNPLYFILGGAFGILPDTMDFKFHRFFVRHDMEVTPDPNRPDPQMIADAVAYAVNRAHLAGKPVRIKLNTIQLGADRWQQYAVQFDVAGNRVVVRYGPVVDTGQKPLRAADPVPATGSKPEKSEPRITRISRIGNKQDRSASARLECPVALDYEATNTIDIFDGPLFRMTPTAEGSVCPEFIPWHRAWSHSLPAAGAMALGGAALLGWLAGAVILAAYCAHIAADQLGFMGSSLFFPFTKKRSAGLGVMHSTESMPNFATVWLACLLIFWNLYRTTGGLPAQFNLLQLLLCAGVLPIAICLLIDRALGARRARTIA